MRSKTELIAGILVLLIVLGVPIGATLAKNVAANVEPNTIDIVLRAYEKGGFSPDRVVVKQGETVRLRLISEDVTHGFRIGDLGIDAGMIEPGKFKIVEFVAEEKGEFSYVCSIRCSPLHSRIRGILVVE
ncbi:MAG: cupredoxin domain-containing protein [Bacillota bacterium]|nr:cupredoxin domain-containing protein [Bacillota bacterium]MDW7673331.1 cupredoxin domain-containing protein [Bacillota bacterium]